MKQPKIELSFYLRMAEALDIPDLPQFARIFCPVMLPAEGVQKNAKNFLIGLINLRCWPDIHFN